MAGGDGDRDRDRDRDRDGDRDRDRDRRDERGGSSGRDEDARRFDWELDDLDSMRVSALSDLARKEKISSSVIEDCMDSERPGPKGALIRELTELREKHSGGRGGGRDDDRGSKGREPQPEPQPEAKAAPKKLKAENYAKMNQSQLKKACEARKLSAGGNQKAMVARLKEYDKADPDLV